MSEWRTIDRADRSPEGVARIFRTFARFEAPQLDSPLYAEFCEGVADDADLLAIAAHAPPRQPPPNLLLAAVHFLLLGGTDDPLAAYYPAIAAGPGPAAPAFPLFRRFCLRHREAIERLVGTRLTQTNVIQRCVVLLPAFATALAGSDQPIALIEIGPSAGLNLNWDRYHYTYPAPSGGGRERTWGDAVSAVDLSTDVRGDRPIPALPARIAVAARVGIDLSPVEAGDADALLWLRALIWPEHVERHDRLLAALAIARAHPPPMITGDAVERLPAALSDAPRDALLCVYATHTLYQFADEARRRVLQTMQRHAAASGRPVVFISQEGSRDSHSEVFLTRYEHGRRETVKLANCNPHGRWIEWLADG